jgi:hypothetical protein
MKKTVYACLGVLVSSAILIAGCLDGSGGRDGEGALDSEGPIGSASAAVTVDPADYAELNPSIREALKEMALKEVVAADFMEAVQTNNAAGVAAHLVKYGVNAGYMGKLTLDFKGPELDPDQGHSDRLSLYLDAPLDLDSPQPTMLWIRMEKGWINIWRVPAVGQGPVIIYPPISTGKKGLTWRTYSHDSTRGQDLVGCNMTCDPYVGDTSCTEVRPILCIRQDGSGSNGYVPSFHYGWAQGNIGLTPPVSGLALTSLAAANNLCVATFGANWRMGEHHDGGGGWAWAAYGNLNDLYNVSVLPYDQSKRFWVHINDQPGNCWN